MLINNKNICYLVEENLIRNLSTATAINKIIVLISIVSAAWWDMPGMKTKQQFLAIAWFSFFLFGAGLFDRGSIMYSTDHTVVWMIKPGFLPFHC